MTQDAELKYYNPFKGRNTLQQLIPCDIALLHFSLDGALKNVPLYLEPVSSTRALSTEARDVPPYTNSNLLIRIQMGMVPSQFFLDGALKNVLLYLKLEFSARALSTKA